VLARALAARTRLEGRLLFVVELTEQAKHTQAVLPDGSAVAEVPSSPFPAGSEFGIAPYAVWHGASLPILHAFIEAGVVLERTALVSAAAALSTTAARGRCVALAASARPLLPLAQRGRTSDVPCH